LHPDGDEEEIHERLNGGINMVFSDQYDMYEFVIINVDNAGSDIINYRR